MPNTSTFAAETPVERTQRPRLWWEIAIVLGLSLGQSAVYSIVTIVDRSTQSTDDLPSPLIVTPRRPRREL